MAGANQGFGDPHGTPLAFSLNQTAQQQRQWGELLNCNISEATRESMLHFLGAANMQSMQHQINIAAQNGAARPTAVTPSRQFDPTTRFTHDVNLAWYQSGFISPEEFLENMQRIKQGNVNFVSEFNNNNQAAMVSLPPTMPRPITQQAVPNYSQWMNNSNPNVPSTSSAFPSGRDVLPPSHMALSNLMQHPRVPDFQDLPVNQHPSIEQFQVHHQPPAPPIRPVAQRPRPLLPDRLRASAFNIYQFLNWNNGHPLQNPQLAPRENLQRPSNVAQAEIDLMAHNSLMVSQSPARAIRVVQEDRTTPPAVVASWDPIPSLVPAIQEDGDDSKTPPAIDASYEQNALDNSLLEERAVRAVRDDSKTPPAIDTSCEPHAMDNSLVDERAVFAIRDNSKTPPAIDTSCEQNALDNSLLEERAIRAVRDDSKTPPAIYASLQQDPVGNPLQEPIVYGDWDDISPPESVAWREPDPIPIYHPDTDNRLMAHDPSEQPEQQQMRKSIQQQLERQQQEPGPQEQPLSQEQKIQQMGLLQTLYYGDQQQQQQPTLSQEEEQQPMPQHALFEQQQKHPPVLSKQAQAQENRKQKQALLEKTQQEWLEATKRDSRLWEHYGKFVATTSSENPTTKKEAKAKQRRKRTHARQQDPKTVLVQEQTKRKRGPQKKREPKEKQSQNQPRQLAKVLALPVAVPTRTASSLNYALDRTLCTEREIHPKYSPYVTCATLSTPQATESRKRTVRSEIPGKRQRTESTFREFQLLYSQNASTVVCSPEQENSSSSGGSNETSSGYGSASTSPTSSINSARVEEQESSQETSEQKHSEEAPNASDVPQEADGQPTNDEAEGKENLEAVEQRSTQEPKSPMKRREDMNADEKLEHDKQVMRDFLQGDHHKTITLTIRQANITFELKEISRIVFSNTCNGLDSRQLIYDLTTVVLFDLFEMVVQGGNVGEYVSYVVKEIRRQRARIIPDYAIRTKKILWRSDDIGSLEMFSAICSNKAPKDPSVTRCAIRNNRAHEENERGEPEVEIVSPHDQPVESGGGLAVPERVGDGDVEDEWAEKAAAVLAKLANGRGEIEGGDQIKEKEVHVEQPSVHHLDDDVIDDTEREQESVKATEHVRAESPSLETSTCNMVKQSVTAAAELVSEASPSIHTSNIEEQPNGRVALSPITEEEPTTSEAFVPSTPTSFTTPEVIPKEQMTEERYEPIPFVTAQLTPIPNSATVLQDMTKDESISSSSHASTTLETPTVGKPVTIPSMLTSECTKSISFVTSKVHTDIHSSSEEGVRIENNPAVMDDVPPSSSTPLSLDTTFESYSTNILSLESSSISPIKNVERSQEQGLTRNSVDHSVLKKGERRNSTPHCNRKLGQTESEEEGSNRSTPNGAVVEVDANRNMTSGQPSSLFTSFIYARNSDDEHDAGNSDESNGLPMLDSRQQRRQEKLYTSGFLSQSMIADPIRISEGPNESLRSVNPENQDDQSQQKGTLMEEELRGRNEEHRSREATPSGANLVVDHEEEVVATSASVSPSSLVNSSIPADGEQMEWRAFSPNNHGQEDHQYEIMMEGGGLQVNQAVVSAGILNPDDNGFEGSAYAEQKNLRKPVFPLDSENGDRAALKEVYVDNMEDEVGNDEAPSENGIVPAGGEQNEPQYAELDDTEDDEFGELEDDLGGSESEDEEDRSRTVSPLGDVVDPADGKQQEPHNPDSVHDNHIGDGNQYYDMMEEEVPQVQQAEIVLSENRRANEKQAVANSIENSLEVAADPRPTIVDNQVPEDLDDQIENLPEEEAFTDPRPNIVDNQEPVILGDPIEVPPEDEDFADQEPNFGDNEEPDVNPIEDSVDGEVAADPGPNIVYRQEPDSLAVPMRARQGDGAFADQEANVGDNEEPDVLADLIEIPADGEVAADPGPNIVYHLEHDIMAVQIEAPQGDEAFPGPRPNIVDLQDSVVRAVLMDIPPEDGAFADQEPNFGDNEEPDVNPIEIPAEGEVAADPGPNIVYRQEPAILAVPMGAPQGDEAFADLEANVGDNGEPDVLADLMEIPADGEVAADPGPNNVYRQEPAIRAVPMGAPQGDEAFADREANVGDNEEPDVLAAPMEIPVDGEVAAHPGPNIVYHLEHEIMAVQIEAPQGDDVFPGPRPNIVDLQEPEILAVPIEIPPEDEAFADQEPNNEEPDVLAAPMEILVDGEVAAHPGPNMVDHQEQFDLEGQMEIQEENGIDDWPFNVVNYPDADDFYQNVEYHAEDEVIVDRKPNEPFSPQFNIRIHVSRDGQFTVEQLRNAGVVVPMTYKYIDIETTIARVFELMGQDRIGALQFICEDTDEHLYIEALSTGLANNDLEFLPLCSLYWECGGSCYEEGLMAMVQLCEPHVLESITIIDEAWISTNIRFGKLRKTEQWQNLKYVNINTNIDDNKIMGFVTADSIKMHSTSTIGEVESFLDAFSEKTDDRVAMPRFKFSWGAGMSYPFVPSPNEKKHKKNPKKGPMQVLRRTNNSKIVYIVWPHPEPSRLKLICKLQHRKISGALIDVDQIDIKNLDVVDFFRHLPF